MVMIVGDDDVDIDEDHNVDVDNYGATHPKTCSTEIVGRVLTTWPNPGNIIRCLSLFLFKLPLKKSQFLKQTLLKKKNSNSHGLGNNQIFSLSNHCTWNSLNFKKNR